ncbi:MAG: hypothetical protein GY810_19770 [Aureispira sp.]|nr:hypothetical protein [Aureispira sp.]
MPGIPPSLIQFIKKILSAPKYFVGPVVRIIEKREARLKEILEQGKKGEMGKGATISNGNQVLWEGSLCYVYNQAYNQRGYYDREIITLSQYMERLRDGHYSIEGINSKDFDEFSYKDAMDVLVEAVEFDSGLDDETSKRWLSYLNKHR